MLASPPRPAPLVGVAAASIELHLAWGVSAHARRLFYLALAGLGLLGDALALDLRKPQDYFHRVWSTAFRAADLADAGSSGRESA